MLAAIGWTLIGFVIGGFVILWIQRRAYHELGKRVREFEEQQKNALARFYQEPDLTFSKPDPTKRKPGRPRKASGVMVAITEPVIMAKPPKKRRIN